MNADGPVIDPEGLNGVRLLSFDGGDIRAVSQLIILDEFMRHIEEERQSTTRILSCDYFHMIGGVGASGIIVIFLTVLRMGIDETIEEFIRIWNQVFAEATLDQSARSARLGVLIRDLLKSKGLDESQRMHNGDQVETSCKAFVCAIPESNLGICEKFRTYKSKETSLNPTVVEAIRATCAVPTLFLPVSVESIGCQVSYVSGAYNFNNPAAETIKEACQYFGRDQRVACMLSLGCGQRAISHLNQANEMKVMSLVKDFACDCERVDRDLGWRIGDSSIYYRLSVQQILSSSGTLTVNPIGEITSCTKGFLDHHETAAKMNKCAQASERTGSMTLRNISGLNEPPSTSVHGLPPLSEFFVERPSLMNNMAQRLFQLGPSIQRRVVLSGLGGIGKTQITIRFLLRYLARFRHILFIDGSSEQSIESGLVAKIKSLGATYARSSAHEALEVLSNPDYEITRDWAIIYDNVDNPEINIGRYIPSCAFGTIIITTRNPNVGMLASKAHLKLDVMSKEEAAEVLLRSAIDPSREPTEVEKEEAYEIAKELGYLPVALVQAGYFIRIHDCMQKYRERLRKRRPDILGRSAEYQVDAHDGLYAALNLTWPHLTPGAQHFMKILGFVNYTGFPIILLYRAAARGFLFESFQLMNRPPSFQDTIQLLCTTFRPQDEWDEQDVDNLISELEKYSLVTRMITFKVKTVRLHPLVHSWTRERLPAEEAEIYRAAAVRLLACGTGKDDEDIYEFIYPHVVLLSNWLGELHANDRAGLAVILAHQGDDRVAITLWEDIKKSFLNTRSFWSYLITDVAYELGASEADLQLALLYWRSGHFEEKSGSAEVLLYEAIKVRKLMLGPDHPKTLEAVQQASDMGFLWKYDTGEFLKGVLTACERQPGNNWEAVLQAKGALARHCDRDKSLRLYTEILQARMERNGPDHHTTLKAMENLANKSSNSASADIWVSLVAARTSRRGREHPDTLDAMENLARACASQHMYDKSVEQWKEVVHLRRRVQGVGHSATIATMRALADMYKMNQQYTEAKMQWKEIVQMTKEARGPNHTDTLKAMEKLAAVYGSSQQYTEAEVQWKEILQMTKEVHGPRHVYTRNAARRLAETYQSSKQYIKAEAEWKEILQVARDAQGTYCRKNLNDMIEPAGMYEKLQRYTEAEGQWKEIVEVEKEAHGPSHWKTLEAMSLLAEMYKRTQRCHKAEFQWKEIVRVTKETRISSRDYTFWYLAALYETCGRYEDAEALLIDARNHSADDAPNWVNVRLDEKLKEVRLKITRAEGPGAAGDIEGDIGDAEETSSDSSGAYFNALDH